jgi:uncharacterized lipoprotein YbaY
LITGRVLIARSIPRFTRGVLRVRIEDVSYADKAARVIAEVLIRDIEHSGSDLEMGSATAVPFSLDPPADIAPDHDYTVRASLEYEGAKESRTVRSDRTYPVLTRGFGSDVTVELGK